VVRTRASLHPDLAGRQSAEEPLDLVPPELSPGNDPPSGVGGVNLKDGLRDVEADEGNLMSHGVLPCQLKLRIVPQRRGPGERGHPCHHARRKIFEIHQSQGGPTTLDLLERIGRLYAIEDRVRGRPPDQRHAIRQAEAAPAAAALHARLEAVLREVSGKSTLAGAIRYVLSHWTALTRYLCDGRLEIDNNIAERAMRAIAIGRKNWLFAGSDGGGAAAAVFYTLIETAKMNGHNPRAWLTRVLDAIGRDRDAVDLDALMPWAMATDPA
jgi:hypothetical protein